MLFLHIFIVTLSIICCSPEAKAYDKQPVLLYLHYAEQQDSCGFNLVAVMNPLVYELILKDQVTLWDSPNKKIKISPQSLRTIEQTNGTTFKGSKDLFINEVWSSDKKYSNLEIHGLSFANKNMINEKVSFGFVDMEELDAIFDTIMLPVNASGYAKTTLKQALYSMRYNFHLLQLGEALYEKNSAAAILEVRTFFSPYKKITGTLEAEKQKRIQYSISPIGAKEILLYELLQDFINLHKEIVINYAADSLASHFAASHVLHINTISVTEIWEKDNQGQVSALPQKITITCQDEQRYTIPVDDLNRYGFFPFFSSFSEWLQAKQFDFNIELINNSEIAPHLSMAYYEALQHFRWNMTDDYVKNY